MGRKKSSGTPGPRANGADVDRRRGGTEDLFTGGGERRVAGDGAAADFPGGGACEDGEVRERCGKEEKGEAGLGLGSCRGKGRREGACRGGGGHQWP
jgi:hypothetical protein